MASRSGHDDTEVFRVSISTNRNAVTTLLNSIEIKLGNETLQNIARLISTASSQSHDGRVALTEALADSTPPRQQPPEETALLIDTRGAAKLLKVSSRTLWAMENGGRMPKAIRIGRAVRWNVAELQAWVGAGCPPMGRWRHKTDKL